MFKVTKRLFSDGKLIGYALTDGNSEAPFDRLQVWEMARNKQIIDVVASGTPDDPTISGTNGFELKSLPQVKWNRDTDYRPDKIQKYTTQDLLGCALREMIRQGRGDIFPASADKKERHNEMMALFRRDLENDVLTNCHTLGYSIKIVNRLIDSSQPDSRISLTGLNANEQEMAKDFIRKHIEALEAIKNNANTLSQKDVSDRITYVLGSLNAKYSGQQSDSVKELVESINTTVRLTLEAGSNNDSPTDLINAAEAAIDALNKLIESPDILSKIKHFTHTAPIVGYRIQNTGKGPIEITRITASKDHTQKNIVLNPGDTTCLSKLEMIVLSARPEIGCRFYNAKVVATSYIKQKADLYENLLTYYVSMTTERETQDINNFEREVSEFVDKDTVATYFVENVAQQKPQATKATTQVNSSSNSGKSIFNQFKR
jgi:hypothetical protein